MILAGDVGGTKSNLGLFDVQGDSLVSVHEKRYPSREHKGLEEIVADFVGGIKEKVTAACFGIAGPVVDGRVHTGNLPWIIDGTTMARELKLPRVRLLNDLEATAYGIDVMRPADLEVLYPGTPAPQTHQVVIAAGTGLGEAIRFWNGSRHVVMACEGGHADFAPHTPQQADLWKFVRSREPYASAEQILSGRGFQTIHEFLRPDLHHPGFDDPHTDPAPAITHGALTGECQTCVDTVNLWIDIYGSEAGNLAIRVVARGGIYIAGGIAIRILPKLREGRFVSVAHDKEKMGDFLALLPVQVVLDEECPLKGAAYVASKGF
jgi:glucokinase